MKTKHCLGKGSIVKLLGGLVIGALFSSGAHGSQAFQLSITPDIAIFDRTERIEGVTIGIWSENPQTALALGIVNGSTGHSSGLSWAFLVNYTDHYEGIQWALINYAEGDFFGWQGGFISFTDGTMKGLQTGGLNYAKRLHGLQLGFINYAETVEAGLQIGVLNIMPQNQWFTGLPNELAPAMVFLNWHF